MVKVCNITKTVGWLLAVCRPTFGWQSTNCWLYVGRLSVDGRPTVGQQLANSHPTDSQQLVDCWPTVGRQVADSIFWELFFAFTQIKEDMIKCGWLSTGMSLYYISTQPFSTTYEQSVAKIIISQGNGKFVAYIHHVWNTKAKISWQEWGGYVGIGSLVCIFN